MTTLSRHVGGAARIASSRPRRKDLRHQEFRPPLAEVLEERALLSYLFVDFGDDFANGKLTTTEGGLRDVSASPTNPVLGTSLGDDSGFNAGTELDIVTQSFTTTDRARMMAVVQRDYAPLNITVVELTSSTQTLSDGRNVKGAASMADVVNTLGAGSVASHDAYVFVATFIADPNGPNTTTYGSNGGGKSPVGTVLGHQTNLSSAVANFDEVAAVYSDGGFSFNTLNNIAHEAGHCFGLQHSLTNPTGTADTNLFPEAELMSYQNTNETTSSMFTRYPMPRGNDNSPGYHDTAAFNAAARTITLPVGSTSDFTDLGFTAGLSIVVTNTASNDGTYVIQAVTATTITLTAAATLTDETGSADIVSLNLNNYNDLASRDGQVTMYDQLRLDPNIGPNPLLDFVSGTGAFDVIRLTRSGSNITVSVQAFGDALHTDPITVPFLGGTIYSYSFAVSASKTILIYTGGSDDQVVIDGNLGEAVDVDGMLGTDSLIVNGLGAANAVYTPNPSAPLGVDISGGVNVPSYGGTVNVGGNIITYTDFRSTGKVAIQNVGSVSYTTNSVGADDLTAENTAGGTPEVTGTVDDGVAAVPLDLTGVSRLVITTGLSNDTLTVDSSNGLVSLANGISYNGNLGANDLRLVQAGGPAQASDVYSVNSVTGMGSDVIVGPSGIQSVFFQNLAPVFDNVPGPLTVVGTASNNTINYIRGSIGSTGLVAVDNLEPIEFTFKTSLTLRGGAGDDAIVVNNTDTPTGLTAITVDGGTGNDTLIVNANGHALTSANITAATVNIPVGTPVPVGYANIGLIRIINSIDVIAPISAPFSAVEGSSSGPILVGSFRFGDLVPPTLFGNASDFTAVIHWGDGTPDTAGTIVTNGTTTFQVFGSHTYAGLGTYNATVTVTDKGSTRSFTPVGGTTPVTITSNAGATTTILSTATVADAPLSSSPVGVVGVEGFTLAATSLLPGASDVLVATFVDANPNGVVGDYSAQISWGDSFTSAATRIVATGTPDGVVYRVYGNHFYAEEGDYPLVVTISDAGGSTTIAGSTVHIADAPLLNYLPVLINTTESPIYPVPVFGAPLFDGEVGTFRDANAAAPLNDFKAVIDWGDGTPTTFGSIRDTNVVGVFGVFGQHTYADSKVNGGVGHFTVTIHISDVGGSELSVVNTANVADRPIVLTGALDTASDSGVSDTDGITNVTHPVFLGHSSPNSIVTVFATPSAGGPIITLGKATAAADGAWQLTSIFLSDGSYIITASAVDQFGETKTGLQTLLPKAGQGPLVIDTVGPKITDVYFDHLNGQVDVVYKDERSGVNVATILDSTNYHLTKPHVHPATFLVTDIAPSSSSDPTAPITVPVTINSARSLRGGFYTFTIRSGGPGNHDGVRDVAGNSLDGEFYGKFPSGNNERGGDFVAMLDAIHRRVFAPQTVVGTADAANNGHGGHPVGAVHSGQFTIARPRRQTPLFASQGVAERAKLMARFVTAEKAVHHVAPTISTIGVHHPKGPKRPHSAR